MSVQTKKKTVLAKVSMLAIHLVQAAIHGGVAEEICVLLCGCSPQAANDMMKGPDESVTVNDATTSAAPANEKEENTWGDGNNGPEYLAHMRNSEEEKPDTELSSSITMVAKRLSSKRRKRRQKQ